jgi:RNA polymerase sigma factor (sigma-70 family)
MSTLAHDPAEDRRLASLAQKGDLQALDALIRRHQTWVFHIAQRMLWNRADAEDATQEILIKTITRLNSFEGRSEFRTWLYRIAGNHLLDCCRSAKSFEGVARKLAEIPDADIPDPNSTRLETALLVEEAKIACTTGILLCLEPRQRLAFLVGEVLGVKDDVGVEVLETSPANFRQILSRARRELYGFLQRQCGLVNQENPCRCAKKTQGFIERGFVSPGRLQFVTERLVQVRSVASDRFHEIQDLERRYAEIFRDQPLLSAPDHAARLCELLQHTGLEKSLGLDSERRI